MRRTLVVLAMFAALGVLAVRVWPVAEPDDEVKLAAATVPRPAVMLAHADGLDNMLPDEVCAGPAIVEMMRHPHWEIVIAEREWDDVADDNPDETLARVHVTADLATWEDADLPQSMLLTADERDELLAAVQRSCEPTDEGNGFSGYYIEVAYGRGAPAFHMPSRSRAAIDAIAVLDRVRGRYVAGRIGTAETMRLTLPKYGLTIERDGHVKSRDGDEMEPLAAVERVDVLDWAMQLPAASPGRRVFTGTLEVAGGRRKVAIDLDRLRDLSGGWRNPLFMYLQARWR